MQRCWLKRDDYLERGLELSSGQKIRVNHYSMDCQGNSNSLVIERKDNGDISAYCFRCGRSGFYGGKFTSKSKEVGEGSGQNKVSPSAHKLPHGTNDMAEWPIQAVHWLQRYGITLEEVFDYGIIYSPSIRRIVLPVFDGNNLCSYQTRRIFADDEQPKYLTYANTKCVLVHSVLRSDLLVICEDYLSAIKLNRVVDAFPLLGVKLQEYHLEYILDNNFKRFVVFLDDDNSQVRRAQLDIKKKLDKIGTCVIHHSAGKDPKDHTEKELQEVLDRYFPV